jgi:hypothetical protein
MNVQKPLTPSLLRNPSRGGTTRTRTSLLVVLLITSAITATLSYLHLSAARERATASWDDLTSCKQQLLDLRADAGSSVGVASERAGSDTAINQLIRESAMASNTNDKLAGIEPGQPARIEGTDYQETPVFLRMDAMPLKSLVTFLYESSSRDPRARCRSIELSAADSPDAWSADVTMGYLSYSPRGAGR